MKCLVCGHNTIVTSTYQNADNKTKRRRECVACGFRFTTREFAEKTGTLEANPGKRKRPMGPDPTDD